MEWYNPVDHETQDEFHEGMEAISQGHYGDAWTKLRHAAEAGHSEAKRYLEMFTRAGAFRGVEETVAS